MRQSSLNVFEVRIISLETCSLCELVSCETLSAFVPAITAIVRNQSIGQYLSVHKDSFSNPPTNRRLEEAVVVDWPKMMRFKPS
ncbi:hypothetical protein AVEN_227471-1 [Araneus ventricosus]|uniref:Uncharacterized protein n=1 Tax=Araneus ventricosus TaxID=182803 RepID=A0A4Y2C5B3_ARAVE|nr:hypothetical protein AVEN_227471-1 [Araneus ventricosus]